MSSVGGLILLLALGGLLYWLSLVLWTVRALSRPPRQTYASAVARGRPGEPSELDTPLDFVQTTISRAGRELSVWDVEGLCPNGPVAIVTHGWGSGKVNALVRMPLLASLCSRVLLWDQPGHGESAGVCTLGTAEVEDLLRIIEEAGADRSLVLCGSSMGAGVSIAAAARTDRVDLVIAEAPYCLARTPARNVMRSRRAPVALNLSPALCVIGWRGTGRWTGPGLSMSKSEPFDRAMLASRLACPLVVFHGDADTTCPPADGRAIARACPQGRFVEISGGTHRNLWKEPACRATMEREYTTAIGSIADA